MPWIKSCLCHQEKKKPPVISPPIHLLLKPEGGVNSPGPSHAFRCKVFKKPRPCHLCHQPIFNQGSCCRVCKYICHKVCESKEAADRFTDTSWKIHRQWLKSNSLPPSTIGGGSERTLTHANVGNAARDYHHHHQHPPIANGNLNYNNNNNNNQYNGNHYNNNNNNVDDIATYASLKSSECDAASNASVTDGGAGGGGGAGRTSSMSSGRRKMVEIQTVQTTLERRRTGNTADIVLHTHHDDAAAKYGAGRTHYAMIANPYHQPHHQYGGVEALTTQPRRKNSATSHNGSGAGGKSSAVIAIGGMDLSYVTERIIALWFPATCGAQTFRRGHRQAAHMLSNKHGDNYKVFNLSDPKPVLKAEHKYVEDVGWSSRLAPPLERLCSVCKQIDSWLSNDQHRIAVLHAKGCKDKLGVIVAAYMHYSNICGTADQALDRFAMRRFLDDNIGPLYLPSNKRYVGYFAGLLSHNIKINSAPLYLTHVTVLGAPAFHNGGCRAFLKLYEGDAAIYTSGVYNVSSGVTQFTVNVAGERRRGLQLRGDILVKCYHRTECARETVFACQFHTCAVADNTLSFTRQELDAACNDPRFPVGGAVELHFSSGPDSHHPGPAPTPAVPVTMVDDGVMRADSPFDADDSDAGDDDDDSDSDDVNHTFGPLDGSIYATIAKKQQELSPGTTATTGTVSSPLTVSMDSGISSAGHQQHAHTTASSASPPPTTTGSQPSPLSPEEQHRELDELLSDMMLTVQSIPDLKPAAHASVPLRYIDDVDCTGSGGATSPPPTESIPYHARQDSRPFSYGVPVVGAPPAAMITDVKRLHSPSLVRKASVNRSNGATLNKVQVQARDHIDDIFTSKALAAGGGGGQRSEVRERRSLKEEFYKDPLKRSYTDTTLRNSATNGHSQSHGGGAYRRNYLSDSESLSPPSGFRNGVTSTPIHHSTSGYESINSNGNLTWLQKQQIKLKERRELQRQEERQPYQHSLITELRSVQNRHVRQSASHRQDGYTSDTTAFADDDDDFSVPLHINTKSNSNNMALSPTSTSTASYATSKSSGSYTMNGNRPTERAFVGVRKEYKNNRNNATSPASALAASPLGRVVKSPLQQAASSAGGTDANGLLISADSKVHQRAEALADLMANLQADNSNNANNNAWQQNYREDNATWRSPPDAESLSSRPQTPAFPVARTPYANSSSPGVVHFDLPGEQRLPPKSPTTTRTLPKTKWSDTYTYERKDLHSARSPQPSSPSIDCTLADQELVALAHSTARSFSDSYSPQRSQNGSIYQGTSRRGSTEPTTQEVSPVHVKFVSDSSRYWYKPSISRDEAISMLRDKAPGTFVVRNSNTFAGGFGMALRVAAPPAHSAPATVNRDELVRHFLIEPTSRGVRIKGCPNEPVFSSLSALVYQHSITQIALPCRLLLPERDIAPAESASSQQAALLVQGAACNVYYLLTIDMESLTGPQAVRKAVAQVQRQGRTDAKIVHFKVNKQGVTLTDNKRELFFRKHYPIATVSHCGLDPDDNRWNAAAMDTQHPSRKIFGFVARKPTSNSDNQCHLFADMDPDQPASAIVSFVNKVLAATATQPSLV